ncbi:hypothetical protein amrb99_97180 [Actinomadura sp. RB99]|nr:hypothetical protein [Actinomadura sp. RB99]
MKAANVTSAISRICSPHGSVSPRISPYAHSSSASTPISAACFSSIDSSSSSQRTAITRPIPGWIPIPRKIGPATSSSRNAIFTTISAIAITMISSPATSAANSPPNATASRFCQLLPWNSEYVPG